MTERAPWVKFYNDDWEAGTSWMPPLVEWSYFRLCRYIWDKGEGMPAKLVPMMLGRDPNWKESIDLLKMSGHVIEKADGSLVVKRALMEVQASNRAYTKRKKAAKKAGKSSAKARAKTKTSERSLNGIEGEPEPEPEPDTTKVVIGRTKKTPIPEGFSPTMTGKIEEFFNEVGQEIFDAVKCHFIDHHTSIGNKFADHNAAFRTWIRRERNFAKAKGRSNKPDWNWIMEGKNNDGFNF